jgi:subfamily B ATP-binding cassette protein MsbA
VQIIQNAATGNLVALLQEIVTAVGVIAVVWAMDWRLTALMAVALPGVVLVTRAMGRRIRRITRTVQDTLAEASAVAEETVSGIRTVMSFAREEYEIDRFGHKVTTLFKAAMQRTRVYATLGPLISLLMYGSLALVLWFGGREVLEGRLTAGQLIAFLFYAVMLTGPLGGLASLYGQVQTALGAAERVFELLDTRSEIVDDPQAEPLPPIAGHVAFHDVSFEYDPRQPVLRNITLEARPGQVVALVGPSGVGKTTLVNLIPRFYDPTAGRITIDGHDVRDVTLRSVRDQIGIVPQETLLFSDTIAANIRYGKLDATQQEIEVAARAANAHDFIIHELPDGYESQVGERGVKLSGGQRQRIAIARAILKDPRILILDEATSSLDTESEQLVQEALERLMHPSQTGTCPTTADGGLLRRTTFVIAHRLSTITTADWVVVLNEGQVVEQGAHADLLAREGSLYRYYYALQFRWDEERPPQPGQAPDYPLPEEELWPDLTAPLTHGLVGATDR